MGRDMRTESVSPLPTPAAGLRYALPSGILVLALGFWHGGMPGVTELFGALTLLFGGVCGAFALRWSRRERALQRGAQVQLMLMAAHGVRGVDPPLGPSNVNIVTPYNLPAALRLP